MNDSVPSSNLPKLRLLPIWKRHILPTTPTTSNDPFEFPTSPASTIKRVKSRTKMNGSTSVKSDIPETMPECQQLSFPSEPAPSPRKIPLWKKSQCLKEESVDFLPSPRKPNSPSVTVGSSNHQPVEVVVLDGPEVFSTPTNPRKQLHSVESTSDLRRPVSTLKKSGRCASLSAFDKVVTTPTRTSPRRKHPNDGEADDLRGSISLPRRKGNCISVSDCDRSVLVSSAGLPCRNSPSPSISTRNVKNMTYSSGLVESEPLFTEVKSVDAPILDSNSTDIKCASTSIQKYEASLSSSPSSMEFSELPNITHINMEPISPLNISLAIVEGKDPDSVIDSSSKSCAHLSNMPVTCFQEFCGDEGAVDRRTCICSQEACSLKSTCFCLSRRSDGLSVTEEQNEAFACSVAPVDSQKLRSKTRISTVPKSGEVSLGMVDKHFTERQFSLSLGHRPELKLTNENEDKFSSQEETSGSCSEYPYDLLGSEMHERSTAYQLRLFEGKTRIKMLKRSGVQVQKDESMESLESIRKSRILCGCHCENGICIPSTCQCALEEIVCQVDGLDEFGMTHPCWCNATSCSNPYGRMEFDPEHGVYDLPHRIRFNSDGEPQSDNQPNTSPSEDQNFKEYNLVQ
ncbi:hypothetical protein KIN20_001312 [Parelaphostrongylus tenuis]|uniref:Cysteine/serine-rich nuclear protein N-terminal domain-containing protein n=1 Tax=Parelaphostrongylus tenuis TaxID=148309 RepID=A0AAD5QCJ8_PARTN|nr:hypothetical protein KIN20_001312 [Parelaphostrongylus tenuis]